MFGQKELMEKINEQNSELESLKVIVEELNSDLIKERAAHEIKLREVLSLKDIENKQSLQELKEDYAQKLIDEKERLNKEFYSRMTDELSKLHSEGNSQTKFVQNLALEMVKGKTTNFQIENDKND